MTDDIRYMSYEQRIAEGYAVPGRKSKASEPETVEFETVKTGSRTKVRKDSGEHRIMAAKPHIYREVR